MSDQTPLKRAAELPPLMWGAGQPQAKAMRLESGGSSRPSSSCTPSSPALVPRSPVSRPAAPEPHVVLEDDYTGDLDYEMGDSDTRVYASFLYEGGACGLAMYAAATGVLATSSSIAPTEMDAVWLLNMFKEQVTTPEVIVTSSSISESLKNELFYLASPQQAGADRSEGGGAIHVQMQAPAAFALEPARRLLASLRIHDTTAGSWLAEPLPGSEVLTLQQQQLEAQPEANDGGYDHSAYGYRGASSGSSGSASKPASAAAARLGSFVDLDDALAVRAAGGLVAALLRVGVLSECGGPGTGVHLPGGVRMFALENFVRMDSAAFHALSIFPKSAGKDAAAAKHKKGGGSSEGGAGRGRGRGAGPTAASSSGTGAPPTHDLLSSREAGFSVYGLLNRCVTAPGSKLLRAWCQRPSVDAALIRHRHDALQFLLTTRRHHPEAWANLRRAQKTCVDLGPVMLRLKTGKAALRDWAALRKSLVSILTVRQVVEQLLQAADASAAEQQQPQQQPLKADPQGDQDPSAPARSFSAAHPLLLHNLVADTGEQGLVSLYSTLEAVIDWGASRAGSGAGSSTAIAVLPGVDPTLDAVRAAYAGLPDVLGGLADSLLPALPSLRSLDVQYIPQIGMVIVVDKAENGIAPGTALSTAHSLDAVTAAQLLASAVPASSHGRRLGTAAGRGTVAADGAGGNHHLQQLYELRPAQPGAGASSLPAPAPPPFPQQIRPAADSSSAASIIPWGFELQFETSSLLVYKNPDARALDEQYGDIAGTIADLEAGILRHLEDRVLGYEAPLLLAGLRLAEADVLAALAEVSGDLGYKRPALVADPVVVAKGVRHPLQELAVPDGTFIPNDVTLAPSPAGPGTLAVVTGPNCSGKSVYLKSVGLLVFLTQIGCFVPAERAAVGLVDGVYTRIESRESAAAGPGAQASSFALDVQQVGLALRHATPRSLLLIDEFGKGTAPIDGVAILATTLRALLRPGLVGDGGAHGSSGGSRGRGVPRGLITTHFHEVLDPDLLLRGFPGATAPPSTALQGLLAQYQMAVVLDDDEPQQAASAPKPITSVTPLFKLVPGRAASSYGAACAARAGIAADVLTRAAAVGATLAAGLPVLPTFSAGTASAGPAARGTSWRDSRRLQKEALRLELVASVIGSPLPWAAPPQARPSAAAAHAAEGEEASSEEEVAPPEAVLAVLGLLAQAV